MGVVTYMADKLVNLVANLGTERDKASHSFYGVPCLSEQQAVNAYRGAWLPRKIVDIPADDETRKWRAWQASDGQIEKIEAEEKRLNVRGKVRDARKKARLFGGAAIYIGTGDSDPSEPLDPKAIGLTGVQYLTVMTKRELTPTDIDRDPVSPTYNKPISYTMANSRVVVHPSRLIVFIGGALPDQSTLGTDWAWGDSVLTPIMEAINQADATTANVASLVFEAKVDVISVPDLMENIADKQYEKNLLERFRIAATGKAINGTLIIDAAETYNTKSANFSTLPDIMDRMMQNASGGADIPATRLLGQSPAGLSATGDADIRNYYDRIQSGQELEITPAMETFDECLIRSALGSRDPSIHYVWNSLWQTSDTERATNGLAVANTIVALNNTRLFPPEALSKAAATALVENSVLPGLEAALDEFGDIPPEELDPEPVDPTQANPTNPAQ